MNKYSSKLECWLKLHLLEGGGGYVEAVKVVLMGSGQKGACNTKICIQDP